MNHHDTERAHILQAIQEQRNALAVTRITGDPAETGRGLVHLAELHGMLEEHAESRRHYEEALGFFQTAGDKEGQAQVLFGLGVARAHFGDHRGAVEHIAQATLIFNGLKDQENEALCRAAIGESLRAIGQPKGAEEKFQEALLLYRQAKNGPRVARLLLDIGDIRMEAGEYEAARKRFAESLQVLRKEPEIDMEALALCELLLGEAEGLLGNHEAARPHLQQAAELYSQLHDHAYESRARWDLSIACTFMQDWKGARAELETVIPLFEHQGRGEDVAKARKVLAHFDSRGV
ncbi:tetratricopeptide repeat protein [Cystobacter fuscus]|uniref:tetratricopeptide repeat protein n=1 Tax=Cystobacter fuscus TaxID=43 RepID=UPI002B2DFE2A|nr:tetratricopeptide repeat protein [Cystobacter fuscus]